MKCFNHQSADAVALCKSCNRALCPDCVVDVGQGCSCRNRCEADVAVLHDLIQRGRTAYQKAGATYRRTGIFLMLIGLLFLGTGILGLVTGFGGPAAYFPVICGVLFNAWGVSQIFSARRIQQK